MSFFLPFFHWADHTSLSHAIRDSLWLFPVIEAFHLIALALLGGTVLLVDMRLLGWGLRRQPTAELARDLQPWMIFGLVVILLSGFLLFMSEPMKLYDNLPFQIKMVTLALALLFTFGIRQRVALSVGDRRRSIATLTAVASVALWSVVGFMGRGIGFW